MQKVVTGKCNWSVSITERGKIIFILAAGMNILICKTLYKYTLALMNWKATMHYEGDKCSLCAYVYEYTRSIQTTNLIGIMASFKDVSSVAYVKITII